MVFCAQLNSFFGPMDLLFYLVRKQEVDIAEIPIAEITEQYLEYLTVIEQIDVSAVGEFLAVAAWLIEIKSQKVLPRAEDVHEEFEGGEEELVRQLLAHKEYRDAARMLEQRSRAWQTRYPRLANDLPPKRRAIADEPIRDVELWDLVSAFARVLRTKEKVQDAATVVYDDTPISVHMQRTHSRLVDEGRVAFGDFFQPGAHKSTLVGVFLGILELVRHYRARVEQDCAFGEIWILPNVDTDEPLDLAVIDSYENAPADEGGDA